MIGLKRWECVQVEVGHIMIEHRKPALLDSFFQVGLPSFSCVSEGRRRVFHLSRKSIGTPVTLLRRVLLL